jgi:hypothetical protein
MSGARSKSWGSLLAVAGLVLVLVALLADAAATAEAKKKSGAPANPAASCAKDSDCVAVPDGCCACSQGGKQRSIPAREKDAHERARGKRCADVLCTQMISNDASCAQAPICAASRCQLGRPERVPNAP